MAGDASCGLGGAGGGISLGKGIFGSRFLGRRRSKWGDENQRHQKAFHQQHSQ
jgi:hypothetical protein